MGGENLRDSRPETGGAPPPLASPTMTRAWARQARSSSPPQNNRGSNPQHSPTPSQMTASLMGPSRGRPAMLSHGATPHGGSPAYTRGPTPLGKPSASVPSFVPQDTGRRLGSSGHL